MNSFDQLNASLAIVDLAHLSIVGEEILKQANRTVGEAVGDAGNKILDWGGTMLQAGKDTAGGLIDDGAELLTHGIETATGLTPSNISVQSPGRHFSDSLGAQTSALAQLQKLAPGLGAGAGGLLGAGAGGLLAKLIQGKPEDEEDAKTDRLNMVMAMLAGGGLGALGGTAASMHPLTQEAIKSLAKNQDAQRLLADGTRATGSAITGVKNVVKDIGEKTPALLEMLKAKLQGFGRAGAPAGAAAPAAGFNSAPGAAGSGFNSAP